MSLSVENLPKNSLAYTNCIYLHPAQIASYKSELSPAPESSSEPKLLLNVGLYVFTALPHSSVSENGIALNGLQRQAASLTLNQVITPSIFTPTASTTASSITLTIDLLAKSKPSNPVPIDTEVLGEMFKQTYDQVS